jgi:Cu/Zn superoxide dismutase
VRKLVPAFVVGALAALAIAAFATAAARDTYSFKTKLTSRAEVPRPKGALTAKGTFTASYVENSTGAVLTWTLNYSRLTGNALAAHIHKGKKGVAGAVIVPLCGPCKNGQKGTAKISKAVISALESGGAYVNVHTKKNQAGEIRGQIKVPGA